MRSILFMLLHSLNSIGYMCGQGSHMTHRLNRLWGPKSSVKLVTPLTLIKWILLLTYDKYQRVMRTCNLLDSVYIYLLSFVLSWTVSSFRRCKNMNLYYLEPGIITGLKPNSDMAVSFFQSTIACIAADVKLRLQSSSFINVPLLGLKGCSMAFALACLVSTVSSYKPTALPVWDAQCDKSTLRFLSGDRHRSMLIGVARDHYR